MKSRSKQLRTGGEHVVDSDESGVSREESYRCFRPASARTSAPPSHPSGADLNANGDGSTCNRL